MHWSNYLETESPIFSERDNRYGFDGLFNLAIEIIEQGDFDLDPEKLPSNFIECNQTLLGTDVSSIASQLFKGKCPIAIVEGLIEDLYEMTELDYPNYQDLIGFKEFESEMLHFTSINHSIGLKKLKTAIDKFSKDNTYIGTWYPDYKRPIELDENFWRNEVFPHVSGEGD